MRNASRHGPLGSARGHFFAPLDDRDLIPDRDAPEGEKEYEVVAKEEKNTYGDRDGYSHDEVIESAAVGVCEGLDDEYRCGCIGCPGDAFDAARLHERRTHIWSAECETQHYYDGGQGGDEYPFHECLPEDDQEDFRHVEHGLWLHGGCLSCG